jgi:hypothetical protein
MSEIERIRSLDDEIFEEFQEYFPKIATSNFIEQYPKTYYIIQMLDTSSTFIKNSLLDSCESDDYYGAKILYRCQIEHFMRFKYVFFNWSHKNNDDFAKHYLEYCDAREVIDSLRSQVSEQQLYDPTFKIMDWDVLLQKHPSFRNKTRREVENETQKYTFKHIVHFLNSHLKTDGSGTTEFLGKFIAEYSNLSSFVHGGTKSYQEILSMQSDEDRHSEYGRICGLSFQMSTTLKLFSLLMYVQTDKEKFGTHYLNVNAIFKRV